MINNFLGVFGLGEVLKGLDRYIERLGRILKRVKCFEWEGGFLGVLRVLRFLRRLGEF